MRQLSSLLPGDKTLAVYTVSWEDREGGQKLFSWLKDWKFHPRVDFPVQGLRTHWGGADVMLTDTLSLTCCFLKSKGYVLFYWRIVDLQCCAESDSVLHLYAFFLYIFFFFHDGLSQEIGYSSLCYTVAPCLSILNVVVCIYPIHPSPSLLTATSLISVWVCFCFVDRFIGTTF